MRYRLRTLLIVAFGLPMIVAVLFLGYLCVPAYHSVQPVHWAAYAIALPVILACAVGFVIVNRSYSRSRE